MLRILAVFAARGAAAGTTIDQIDFGDAIPWKDGFIADDRARDAVRELVKGGYIIEHNTAFELTPAGTDLVSETTPIEQWTVPAEMYAAAQRAMADLKAAVYSVLASAPGRGLTNAEIGRALGIYAGHIGHEGHISRTILSFLESEGVAKQDARSKRWRLASR